ncbi:hypothetical protein B296_00047009 [Ensete ventricosum]|uniref:Uncharacterized protein n=1 Tax=Ensete ventricosum TaxID=4639 RepID=A0A426X7D6_ENSVE|nr:hypothetical protein B296_00047009 [Ensete ventricosum]
MTAGAGVGGAASSVIQLGIEMRSCDMGPPSSAKILGSSRNVASLSNDAKSYKRPEPSSLGSVESFRRSSQGSAPLKKDPPGTDMYLIGHQLLVVGGASRWLAAALALTRRLLPAVRIARGYCSSVDCRAYPNTPLVASYRGSGRGLVWHIGSAALLVDRGTVGRPQGRQRIPRGQVGQRTLGQHG